MQPCRLIATQLACRRGDRVLFCGVSFALEAGGAVHLTGPNGIGKSSLIRILAGLLRPLAGTVEREGEIALADERAALDLDRPLGHALDFWKRFDRADALGGAIAALALGDLLDVPVGYLSTGQRKRAVLARTMLAQAPIWLLDEPLNGLDTRSAKAVETLAAEHCAAGGIAVIASHQAFALPGIERLELERFAPTEERA